MLQAFDDLLLLKSGGVVTYHGSLGKRSCRLVHYFQVSTLVFAEPSGRFRAPSLQLKPGHASLQCP